MAAFTCNGVNADIGTAQTLVGAVDCFVEQAVAQSYGTLTNPGSSFGIIVTAALTIYIALLGLQLMLGRTQLRLGELVPKFMLIGAILALTASWGTWQALVYNVLTDGPEEIAQMVSGAPANSRSVTERVDYVAGLATDVASVWGKSNAQQAAPAPNATPTPQSPTDLNASNQPTDTQRAAASFLPNVAGSNSPGPSLLIWSALLFTLASAGVLAISKALLALLLALGPLFAIFALFRFTRDLMLGWARAAMFLALIPILSILTSLAALELIQPMAEGMGIAANQGTFSLKSAVAFFVVVLVIIGVSILVFRVAGIMTSRWTMNLSTSTGSPQLNTAPVIVGGGTQSSPAILTSNPRVDVILNALERNLTQSTMAPSQNGADMRGENISSSQQITRIERNSGMIERGVGIGTDQSPQRRIELGRNAQSRSPLRPVRGGA